MTLGFVCTNYNSAALTRDAIASLRAAAGGRDVPVVVVDNNSRSAEVEALRVIAEADRMIEVIFGSDNIGYFPGLNVGIARLRERWPAVRHLVIGNNDLLFPAEFVTQVAAHASVLEEWAVVSPDLVTLDGVHQNPHVLHPVSRLRRLVWDAYYASYAGSRVIGAVARMTRGVTRRRENDPASELHKTAGPVEQGYGACYLIGPRFFRHFDRLFAPTFLMQEEFFLGEQLQTIGQLTYYDPRIALVHRTHGTVAAMPSRHIWGIARESHLAYKRYLGLSPERRRAMVHDATGVRP